MTTTTDQLLPAIRSLADRYGLPDGIDYSQDWQLLCFDDECGTPPYWIDPEESQLFPTWLAAFAAHVEAQAEVRDGLEVHRVRGSAAYRCWAPKTPERFEYHSVSYQRFTPGDTLSRITARLLALDDGVTATGGSPC